MNEEEIAAVILENRGLVCATAWNVLRDYHLADDVFQDVMLRALRRPEHFENEEHLLRWSKMTARNRAIDVARRREGRNLLLSEAVLDLLEQERAEAPSDVTLDRCAALHLCLERVPEKTRRILELRYQKELSCQEVADEVVSSVDAVYKILSRIHLKLRGCIETEVNRMQVS